MEEQHHRETRNLNPPYLPVLKSVTIPFSGHAPMGLEPNDFRSHRRAISAHQS